MKRMDVLRHVLIALALASGAGGPIASRALAPEPVREIESDLEKEANVQAAGAWERRDPNFFGHLADLVCQKVNYHRAKLMWESKGVSRRGGKLVWESTGGAKGGKNIMVEEVLSLESRSDGEGSKWHFCIAANVPGEEDSDFTFEAILRLSGNEGETGKGYNWQAKNVYYDKSIEMEPKPKPKEECVPFAEARTSWAKVNAFTQNLERAPIGGQEAALEHFP